MHSPAWSMQGVVSPAGFKIYIMETLLITLLIFVMPFALLGASWAIAHVLMKRLPNKKCNGRKN